MREAQTTCAPSSNGFWGSPKVAKKTGKAQWGSAIGSRRSVDDAQQRIEREREAERRDEMPLEKILARPGGDTRPVQPHHVLSLAESISAVGLIEPVVVDAAGRLLAGGHRIEALRLLAEPDDAARVARWCKLAAIEPKDCDSDSRERITALEPGTAHPERVPVRVFERLDAAKDPDAALAIEASENLQRRSYTPDELRGLAARLRAAGFTDRPGRPRTGERALRPALAVIAGLSLRTIHRAMGELEPTKTMTGVMVSDALESSAAALTRAARRYVSAAAEAAEVTPQAQALRELAEQILATTTRTP